MPLPGGAGGDPALAAADVASAARVTSDWTVEIDFGNAVEQALDPLIRLLLSATSDLTAHLLQISVRPL
jgi:hypothetical protein